ncbi:hypothetical protein IEQ34_009363 [Dendrobium chrysotoxum]|uniref:Uncharacterized protein n=1 Tax=Dendrobium chrysotoxum TaxID=161865 RepID=A0AAV7H1D8_DENCH|nr:hypothetical protein IEQ34_009363 [Dendrobium chrysotoxum]
MRVIFYSSEKVRLNGVATLIGTVGLSVAALFLAYDYTAFLMVRFFTSHTKIPDGSVQFVKGHTSVKDAIDGAVKILTGAVCLPLVVTLTSSSSWFSRLIDIPKFSLAYSMKKILADKALMTVVEAHVGVIKLTSRDDRQELSSSVCS